MVYTAPAKPKKEEKPKEAPKPKAAEKAKPKKEEAEEEDDDIPKEEPKPKNPLDSLPKSSFNLEDWKRKYSNFDTRGAGGSLEWFYEKYIHDCLDWRFVLLNSFSFVASTRRVSLSGELTSSITKSLHKSSCLPTKSVDTSVRCALTFYCCLSLTIFVDRLEESRKYLFGSLGVLGTANNSYIAGVFVTRGPEIEATVKAAPDYESYNYKRIDPFTNQADKEFFEAAMAWDLELGGKKWADGKVVC